MIKFSGLKYYKGRSAQYYLAFFISSCCYIPSNRVSGSMGLAIYSISEYFGLCNTPIEWSYTCLFALSVLPLRVTNDKLELAKREFSLIEAKSLNYKLESNIEFKNFQMFINGLYQAEGISGVYFPKKDSLRVVFYFSIGQNYSPEAALLLLRLRSVLGVGSIKIESSTRGIPHIRYIVTNTKDILNKIVPYFTYLYGQKRLDLAKLHSIYDLSTTLCQSFDKKLALELIHLVYSTNPEGQERKVTLADKLSIYDCSLKDSFEYSVVSENTELPSIFFIIGLFLGDGSLGFVFDEPKSRAPKFYIKIIFNFASQKATEFNVYLLTLIAKSMELEPRIYKKGGLMLSLEYSGEIVYRTILPILSSHRDWLYWRERNFNIALSVAEIQNDKRHLTREGYKEIIELLFSVPNNYAKPKEYWLDLIEQRKWK